MAGTAHVPKEVHRRFWRLIAAGWSTERAAHEVGVERTTGLRWFTDAGGMPPLQLAEPSGRYLSFAEREEIALGRAAGVGIRQIARQLGRSPSTISRELARGCLKRRPRGRYKATVGQARAEQRARRPKPSKLAATPLLQAHVQAQLLEGWSPEQIAGRLPDQFPHDERMRISHEAIYQALFVQGRGGLRRELTACLRTGRALRRPQRRADGRRERIKDKVLISERPAEADDRAVPGHWEGDLILGAGGTSAIGTLVERSTRFLMLLHLPDDHRAETVRDAIVDKITTLPVALRRSLTWDQGIELARTPRSASPPTCPSTSAIRTAPGSGAATRTPTACSASTSPRTPTWPATPPSTSTPSPPSSTAAPARPSRSRPPPKSSPSYFPATRRTVLRRPVESAHRMTCLSAQRS